MFDQIFFLNIMISSILRSRIHNMNSKKSVSLIFVFLLFTGWICFIFTDAYSQKKDPSKIEIPKTTIMTEQHESAPQFFSGKNEEQQTPQESGDSIAELIQSKIQMQNSIQDLQTLQKIYEQKKTPEILQQIIQKQAQNYDFNTALDNISKLKNDGQDVDANLHIHIYINSNAISINQPESIQTILPLMEAYINEGKLTEQDYVFYQGLIQIWNKNYTKALEIWQSVQSPTYLSIIQSFDKAIHSYDASKAIPPYYQDGLVALAALKNGYFTIARKIALETVLKNEKYILPYQILAYSHFLTNNRDTAIEYFLKLSDFDEVNKSMYKFLIGVSYYRKHDHASSTLYLSQADSEELQTDQLRYLILNYIGLQDNTKLNSSRQKLLGQKDINPSDFYLYFYTVFYKAYFSQDVSLYTQNTQLPLLFISKCQEQFS